MKKSKIFWGLFFIAGAILMLVSQIGLLPDAKSWSLTLLGSVLLVAILIRGIIKQYYFTIFFPLAGLILLYARQLSIESLAALTPQVLFGAAFLLSIGFHILFPRKGSKGIVHWDWNNGRHAEKIVDQEDESTVYCSISFGAGIKYINSENFESARLESSFGSLKVYFDNVIMQKPEAYVHVENSFSGMELYIPKTWTVINQMDNAFGGTDVVGHPAPDGIHKLYLQGDNSFGGMKIIYI